MTTETLKISIDIEKAQIAALEEVLMDVWNQAIEAAARDLEIFHENNVGMVHPITISDAKRIRKLKK